ncbi:MAG: ABC transporter ATP-binding protein [Spirochaetota bacterium]|nr:ABC transporter ATP-binding protein [Spirochaetota bacterium]
MLELKSVSKMYKFHSNKLLVLDNVNFKIERGCFISLMGKSGSGKTTLLNIISGIIKPSSGVVQFNGKEVKKSFDRFASKFRKENVGYVFQQFNLIPYYTALENVIAPLKFTSHHPKTHKSRGMGVLDKLGILDKKDYYPNLLSGGQMQRVAIARALVTEPKLIIADEPSGNLDQSTANEIIDLFKKLNSDNNVGFLIATHDREIISSSKEIYKIESKTLLKV